MPNKLIICIFVIISLSSYGRSPSLGGALSIATETSKGQEFRIVEPGGRFSVSQKLLPVLNSQHSYLDTKVGREIPDPGGEYQLNVYATSNADSNASTKQRR